MTKMTRSAKPLTLLAVGLVVAWMSYEIIGASRADTWYDVSIQVSSKAMPIQELWYSDTSYVRPGADLSDQERQSVLSTFTKVVGPPFRITYENAYSQLLTTSGIVLNSHLHRRDLQLIVQYANGDFECLRAELPPDSQEKVVRVMIDAHE